MKNKRLNFILILACIAACGIYFWLAWKDQSVAMAMFGVCFLFLAWYLSTSQNRRL